MGSSPAYDSPTSKGTSGMPEPFTANSRTLSELPVDLGCAHTLRLVGHEAVGSLLQLWMLERLARDTLLNGRPDLVKDIALMKRACCERR
jgi:hypothetical protein